MSAGMTGRLRERNRVGEFSRVAAAEKAGDLELAGLAPEFVPLLDFPDQLELREGRVEIGAERD